MLLYTSGTGLSVVIKLWPEGTVWPVYSWFLSLGQTPSRKGNLWQSFSEFSVLRSGKGISRRLLSVLVNLKCLQLNLLANSRVLVFPHIAQYGRQVWKQKNGREIGESGLHAKDRSSGCGIYTWSLRQSCVTLTKCNLGLSTLIVKSSLGLSGFAVRSGWTDPH